MNILLLLFAAVLVNGQPFQNWQDGFPAGCSGTASACLTTENAVCNITDISGGVDMTDYTEWVTVKATDETHDCVCDWDYEFDTSHACTEVCDCNKIDDAHATAYPPQWDLLRSGFKTSVADEIVFAIKQSSCYDTTEYAFGIGPIPESDWAEWEHFADTAVTREEDCWVNVGRQLTWFADKTDVIHAIHDPNSPMLLVDQWDANGSNARVPLRDEYVSMFNYYNEFIVYDGCLNTREVTTFAIEIGGETFNITRHVDNVLKFKIEFPTRLEICTNITVEVVEIEEVLVNQTVYCTETGGFEAQLEFQTFVTWPYKMNVTDGAFDITMDGLGSDCFNLTMSLKDDSNCVDNSTAEPVCVQTWDLAIVPDPTPDLVTGINHCEHICTINGEYTVVVNLEPQTTAGVSDLNPTFDRQRTFKFTVESANFCSQVIAEAEITQTMDAFHDDDRDISDKVFFVEDRVYLEAKYDSADVSIYEVDKLYFTVKNMETGSLYTLYDTSLEFALTQNGTMSVFTFAEPEDEFTGNPAYVWPEFDIADSVFNLALGVFPITLELCLGVNLTFFGNQNDGSSGNMTGLSTDVPEYEPLLLELLEMVDRTKYQQTEIRRQVLLLQNGAIIDAIKEVGPADEVEFDPHTVPISAFSILTFVLAAAIFVSLGIYAVYVCSNKGKYAKINTRVDVHPRDIIVS